MCTLSPPVTTIHFFDDVKSHFATSMTNTRTRKNGILTDLSECFFFLLFKIKHLLNLDQYFFNKQANLLYLHITLFIKVYKRAILFYNKTNSVYQKRIC